MADQLGVYICSGCGIGEVVNTEALPKAAGAASSCQTHGYLCSPEGVSLIRQDLEGRAEGPLSELPAD